MHARTHGVVLHDDVGPLRHILFSIGTAPVSANSSGQMVGAPQKVFQPKRAVASGTQYATGGTPPGNIGLVITSIFIGNDLQQVNLPSQLSAGVQVGTPIEFFSQTAFDTDFDFDAAGPAISITVNLYNATSAGSQNVFMTFKGDAVT